MVIYSPLFSYYPSKISLIFSPDSYTINTMLIIP
nr:MAG TPA: hypothetical protein [Caudoviricetes sp.]